MGLITAGFLVALIAYGFLVHSLIVGKATQNFTTWFLWALLDAIAATSILYQGGNSWNVVLYVFGSTAIAFIVLKSGTIMWTWFETMIVCLVVACLVIWKISDAKMATIASTIAVIIAGIPQLVEAYQKPEDSPLIVYVGFLLGNILATVGGKEWSVQERFYTTMCGIYCGVYALLIARKFLNKNLRTEKRAKAQRRKR